MKVEKMPVNFESFSSIASFKKAIETRKNSEYYRNDRSSEENDRSFTGSSSMKEATDLFVKGYAENLPKIKQQTKAIANNTDNGMLRKKNMMVAGAFPIIPKYLSGMPNNMVMFEKQNEKLKTVHLYYDVTASCSVSSRDLERAGVCVAGLIAMFEKQGYRIKIELGFTSVGGRDIDICKVLLKDYTDYANWLKLAYPLTHPSFFRRHMFKWLETTPVTKEHHGGYGRAMYYEADGKTCKEIMQKRGIMDKQAYFVYYNLVRDCNYDTKTLYNELMNNQ